MGPFGFMRRAVASAASFILVMPSTPILQRAVPVKPGGSPKGINQSQDDQAENGDRRITPHARVPLYESMA